MADIERSDGKKAFLDEFESLRPDLFFPEQWTAEQKAEANSMLKPSRIKTGMLSAIPMSCEGDRCVYAAVCPLLAENLAPLKRPCPIEMAMVQQFFQDYVEELGVDTGRMVEVSMVRDLVDQEVQYMRKTRVLAQEHFIQENVVGVDANGKVVTQPGLHTAVEFEDRIHRRKEKLRSALLATREARAKAGQGSADTAMAISQIIQDVKKFELEKERALKKKLGIYDRDEYIEDDVEDAEIVEDNYKNQED